MEIGLWMVKLRQNFEMKLWEVHPLSGYYFFSVKASSFLAGKIIDRLRSGLYDLALEFKRKRK